MNFRYRKTAVLEGRAVMEGVRIRKISLFAYGSRCISLFGCSDCAGDQRTALVKENSYQCGGTDCFAAPVPSGCSNCLVLCVCVLYCCVYCISGGNRRLGACSRDVAADEV